MEQELIENFIMELCEKSQPMQPSVFISLVYYLPGFSQ